MNKKQYIEEIIRLMEETNDTIILSFIYNLLRKTSLKKAS